MSTLQVANAPANPRRPWNKGKLVGPKPPLQPKHVWAIRTRLQMQRKVRDLALFNLAIDSKLRGCDVVSLNADPVILQLIAKWLKAGAMQDGILHSSWGRNAARRSDIACAQ